MPNGYIDKRMGGIFRDSGLAGQLEPGSDIYNLIEELINNAFVGYNQELKEYIDELYQQLDENNYTAGDEITQEMIDYFNSIVNNMRTILTELIENNPNLGDSFETYVENLISDLETYVNNLTLGDTYTQEFKDYIDNLLTQITNIFGDPTGLEDLRQYIDNLFATFEANNFNIGDEITQEMIDYFQSIIDQLHITKEQISNLDEINQEFKDYIDNLFQDFEDYIDANYNLGDTLTEEIKNYIDDSITNLVAVLKQFIENYTNQYFSENVTQIIKKYYDEYNGTRLISGSVTWLQLLDFEVSHLVYEILGNRYESAGGLITIPPNTSSDPMFAVIYADVYGEVSYILGTPAAAPSVPAVNQSTQIALTTVYIPGNGTEPAPDPGGETETIANEIIYDENTEWTTAKTDDSAITTDFDAVTDPANGTKHIAIATTGGATNYERTPYPNPEKITSPVAMNIDIAAELTQANRTTTDLGIKVSKLFPDHMTDVSADGVRTLTVYNYYWQDYITAIFKNTSTGATITAIMKCYNPVVFEVTELGTRLTVPEDLRLIPNPENIPAGNYDVSLTGFYKYKYLFSYTGSGVAAPTAAQLSFTRASVIDATGGNIILSIKNSAQWLETTAFLLELYSGADKVGSMLFDGNFAGFNPDDLEYQRVTIPVADFNPTAAEIDKLVMIPVNTWPGSANCYIDNIVLQTGLALPDTEPDTAEDKYVSAGAVDAAAKITLERTEDLPNIEIQLGTMALKTFWTGSQAEYDAIGTKDANTIYHIEEE